MSAKPRYLRCNQLSYFGGDAVTDQEIDVLIDTIGRIRDRVQRLYDDQIIAHHKGFSASGATEDEITADIMKCEARLEALQDQLDRADWA